MGNTEESVRKELRETLALMQRAARELSRASARLEETDTPEAWNLSCGASVAKESMYKLVDDLERVLEGDEPVRRVPMLPTGLPWKEDPGGGFGASRDPRARSVPRGMDGCRRIERAAYGASHGVDHARLA